MRKSWLAVGLLFVPTVASAHIHLTSPKSRTDSAQGDPQKDEHCGLTGYVRADHPDRITSYLPGSTITVTWAETINHPGYYRIAFQPNGETFTIPPASNGDAVVGGVPQPGNMPTEDRTGQTDATTGAMILKDRIPDGTLTTDITLPNMECNNCTLQFMQVMIDKPLYTVDAASDDIYFNCADIVLTANPQPPATPDAGTNPDPTDPGTGENGNTTTGGCATGGGLAGLPVGLALLGLVAARRRRTLRA